MVVGNEGDVVCADVVKSNVVRGIEETTESIGINKDSSFYS